MTWVIKIVKNGFEGIQEVHIPYEVDGKVDNIKIGDGIIQIEFKTFNTKNDAQQYFDNFEEYEEVKFIKSYFGNKYVTVDRISN